MEIVEHFALGSVMGRKHPKTSVVDRQYAGANRIYPLRKSPAFAQQMATSVAGAQAAGTSFSMEVAIPVAEFYGLRLAALNARSAPPAAGLTFQVGVISQTGGVPSSWAPVTFSGQASPTFSGVPVDLASQEQVLSDVVTLTSLPRTDGGSGCLVVVKTTQTNSVAGWSYISRSGSVRCADVIPMTPHPYVSVLGIGDSIMAGSDAGMPLKGYVEEACASLNGYVPIVLGMPGVAAVNYEKTFSAALALYRPGIVIAAPWSPNGVNISDTAMYARAAYFADECAKIGARYICAGPCVTQNYVLADDNKLKQIRTQLASMFGSDFLDLYGLLSNGASPGRFAPAYYGANNYHPSAAGRSILAAALINIIKK